MNRALLLMIMGAALAAAEPAGTPVIENAAFSGLSPLGTVDMKRMASGMPPRVATSHSVAFELRSSWFGYSCVDCAAGSIHHGAPRLSMRVDFAIPFTAAAILQADDAQGGRFLRGADGAIRQLTTMKDTLLVHERNGVIRVDRYLGYDCEVGPDGVVKPLPGAKCRNYSEIREIKEGAKKDERLFEVRGTDVIGDFRMTIELTERKGQSQVVTEYFRSRDGEAETLLNRGLLQRVYWPEGPGYRQIRKSEAVIEDQPLQLIEHVVETWMVAPDGGRTMTEKQELVRPPGRAPDGEPNAAPSDSEEIH